MEKIFEFLKKCSDCYYNSFSYYLPHLEDIENIEKELDIIIPLKEVDDETYDKVYYKAKDKYPFHPFFGDVGANVENEYGKDIKFDKPMGSMTELKKGDWDKWRIPGEYVISEKLDGLSVILYYKNGRLVQAASRGDGYIGKDITRHIMYITNIPQKIEYYNDLEVRGELICPKKDIQSMIDELKIETGKEYKNGRNTIAGFLNSKKTLKSVAKYAKFNAFDSSLEHSYENDRFNYLEHFGFNIPKYSVFNNQMLSEDFLIEHTTFVKTNSDYECDGIILTLNKVTEGYLGYETGTINPKKSRKFKISNIKNDAETIVTNINWQISKGGKFTPVVQIEPVQLAGVTISNVTGHNYQNIIDNGIGIGSKIRVVRSGDVIPYIKEIITPVYDNYNLPNIDTIINGVDLELADKNAHNEYTDEMNILKIVFFAKTLGIDYLGYGNVKALYDKFNTFNSISLLTLNESAFNVILGENGKKAYNSIQSKIETFTEVDYMSALCAFGENLNTAILQSVFDKYHTLDVTEAQLRMINGFGDTRIKQYLEWIDNYRYYSNKLKELGINYNVVEKQIISDKYSSYIVCFTGVRDKELSQIIRNNGGIASDSWNKNVNLLVCADPNGTSGKITKAREKGIKCISLEEAKEMFNE